MWISLKENKIIIHKDNNNKNGAFKKAFTTKVSKRYNKQNTMIKNYVLNETKHRKDTLKKTENI